MSRRRASRRNVGAEDSNSNGVCAVSVAVAAGVTGTEAVSAAAKSNLQPTRDHAPLIRYVRLCGGADRRVHPVSSKKYLTGRVIDRGGFPRTGQEGASNGGFSEVAVVRRSGWISSAAAAPMGTVIASIVSAGTNRRRTALGTE